MDDKHEVGGWMEAWMDDLLDGWIGRWMKETIE